MRALYQLRSLSLLLGIWWTGLVTVFAATNLPPDRFTAGIAAYESGQFAAAARTFHEAATNAPAVGTFLNLGLSEWRRGRAGAAICAWEQARWIAPQDAAARNSLAYARRMLDVEAPALQWYERVSAQLPASAWAWLGTLGLWLAVAALLWPDLRGRRRSAWSQAGAALGLTMLLLSGPAQYGVYMRRNIGFVLQRDAALRLTPTLESEVTVKLPAGEPGRQLRAHGNYVLVRTTRGEGWLERRQFGLVVPP